MASGGNGFGFGPGGIDPERLASLMALAEAVPAPPPHGDAGAGPDAAQRASNRAALDAACRGAAARFKDWFDLELTVIEALLPAALAGTDAAAEVLERIHALAAKAEAANARAATQIADEIRRARPPGDE